MRKWRPRKAGYDFNKMAWYVYVVMSYPGAPNFGRWVMIYEEPSKAKAKGTAKSYALRHKEQGFGDSQLCVVRGRRSEYPATRVFDECPGERVMWAPPARKAHRLVPRLTSGYVDCACRDCFDSAITSGGPALCGSCVEAGCDKDGGSECRRSDAYGGE